MFCNYFTYKLINNPLQSALFILTIQLHFSLKQTFRSACSLPWVRWPLFDIHLVQSFHDQLFAQYMIIYVLLMVFTHHSSTLLCSICKLETSFSQSYSSCLQICGLYMNYIRLNNSLHLYSRRMEYTARVYFICFSLSFKL